MKFIKSIIILIIINNILNFISCQCLTKNDTRHRDKKNFKKLYLEQNKFNWDLFKQLNNENQNGNVLFSPYSTQQVLNLVYYVSNGTTEQKFHDALRIPADQDKINVIQASRNEKLYRKFLNTERLYKFLSADRIYVPIDSKIKECIKRLFKKNIKHIDFGNPIIAAKKINKWIAKQTEEHISDAVTLDQVQSAELLLINAVYFQGTWMNVFDKTNTKDAVFHLHNDTEISHPMMRQVNSFNYGDFSKFKMIELQYDGLEVSMFIILPRGSSTVDEVLENLTWDNFEQHKKKLREQTVEIEIPKFSVKTDYDLTSTLKSVGLEDVIQKPVDLSYIMPHKHGVIDSIIHKATIDVDEVGTVATAVTMVLLPRMLPKYFICTRPFIYIIQNKDSKHVLFAGVLRQPEL